jgi:hypothetical protein
MIMRRFERVTNIIYEDRELYNEEIKREFINNYKESTRSTVERIFKVSRLVEEDLNKDLFNLSREQIRKLLFLFTPKTDKSSQANVAWISAYIQWAIDEGHRSGINPLDGVDRSWSKQFVVTGVKQYWTDDEVFRIIEKCANAQDAVIISLLFHGVRGTANSEILNLMKESVDAFHNWLHLKDDRGRTRTIEVSERCIKLCEAALKEYEYEKRNGNPSGDIKAPFAKLVDNKYVVRSSHTRTNHFSEAEKNIVNRRLSVLSEEIGEPSFKVPLNLVHSGMLAMGKDLYEKYGKFDDEEIELVLKQFGEEKAYSAVRIKQEFLNLETIKSLYKLT